MFIKWYRLLFITIPSFLFSSSCIVVTEYPAVNKLTALCLAPKSTIVVVAWIYACYQWPVTINNQMTTLLCKHHLNFFVSISKHCSLLYTQKKFYLMPISVIISYWLSYCLCNHLTDSMRMDVNLLTLKLITASKLA